MEIQPQTITSDQNEAIIKFKLKFQIAFIKKSLFSEP